MNPLKMHVERIVRPISANYARKDQMREELLAHLTGLYEEEIANEGDPGVADEEAALARAVSRFGDPAKLRADLQDSVPLLERVMFLQFMVPASLRENARVRPVLDFLSQYHFKRPGESPVGHAARMTKYLAVMLAAFYAPLMALNAGVRIYRGGNWDKWLYLATFAVAIAAAVLFACFVLVLIGHRLHRALEDQFWGRASWIAAAGYGALSSATVLLAGCVFWLIARRNVEPGIYDLVALAVIALAMPLVLVLMVRFGLAEFRRFGEWGKLETEE